jgi:DNA mismatch repair ATPase MutS
LKNPEEQYLKRKDYYSKLLKRQVQTINFFSAIRFIIFIAGVGFTVFFLKNNKYYLGISIFTMTLILFIILVKRHNILKHNKKSVSILCGINENSIKRLNGEWKKFIDIGEEFMDDNHNYSKDLDIFGDGSLFQWINTACTYTGRKKLKEALESAQVSIGEIRRRQEAIKELARNIGWRQRFMAEGIMISDEIHNPDELIRWGKDKRNFIRNSLVISALRIIPVITIMITILYFTTSKISYQIPLIAASVQGIILIPGFKERNRILDTVYKYKQNIKVYNNMLKLIEKKNFNSEYLKALKDNFINSNKKTASEQINSLVNIVNFISDRSNIFYLPLNIITLWDYQCLILLERWKKYCGSDLEKWIDTIGAMEELSSLAVIRYDHPDWDVPEVKEGDPIFKAEEMGHPLLSNRVANDLSIYKQHSILLITGSNMSGKSTLLRTAGINLVLAYAGAPVCAKSFCCSIMKIYTCMRISDNLEKRISSFYAELLRIKTLVKAVKEKETVFFLLDEIFKGTNSADRHTGASVLIDNLSNEDALGLVSTHDLELCDIEQTNQKVRNYHFREYYKDNEICFDYKLRVGCSTTRNALYLMKMAGIDM